MQSDAAIVSMSMRAWSRMRRTITTGPANAIAPPTIAGPSDWRSSVIEMAVTTASDQDEDRHDPDGPPRHVGRVEDHDEGRALHDHEDELTPAVVAADRGGDDRDDDQDRGEGVAVLERRQPGLDALRVGPGVAARLAGLGRQPRLATRSRERRDFSGSGPDAARLRHSGIVRRLPCDGRGSPSRRRSSGDRPDRAVRAG